MGLALWGAVVCLGIVVGASVVLQAESPERSPSGDADAEALPTDVPVESEREGMSYATDSDRTTRIDSGVGLTDSLFPDANVTLDVDPRTGIDVDVSTGPVGVSLSGLGGNGTTQSGTISHEAVDEGVERSSNAGLCAVGLSGPNAPASFDVDGGNGTVSAEFNESRAEPNDAQQVDPMAIVERCGTWDE